MSGQGPALARQIDGLVARKAVVCGRMDVLATYVTCLLHRLRRHKGIRRVMRVGGILKRAAMNV